MRIYRSYEIGARMRHAALVVGILAISLVLPIGCIEAEDTGSNIAKVDALYRKSKLDFPQVPDISAAELIEKMKTEKIILVDDREAPEQRVSMIPGAVPASDFERDIDGYANTTIVVYCTIGDRSGHYTQALQRRGIDAHNLKGGVLAWSHAGGTYVDGQGKETNRVHVYGRKWNLLAEGYTPVW